MKSPEQFAIVGGAVARNAIASAVLLQRDDAAPASERQIGRIMLHPQQVEAVQRIRASFDELGGALLCDPVGTGKTFVALALADDGAPVVVVAPAVLRPMWNQAAELCNRVIIFYSMEALSRGKRDLTNEGNLLIVDEAHHVRNSSTGRYRAVANLARSRRTLLLTATPIHNSRRELTSLLALFLGNRASTLSAAQSGRCIVRRDSSGSSSASKPVVRPLEWLQPTTTSRAPELLLRLPPPLPPSDGGDGGVLVAHSLIRQWMSSNAALEGGLTRRLHRSVALIAALEDGTYPSKDELRAWVGAGDSVQLAFASLLSSPSPEAAELLHVVNVHRSAVSDLRNVIRRDEAIDDERAQLIVAIRARHRGEKIVAFSQYADTIDTMFRRLAAFGYVASLTGEGGSVAGGKISRNDAIERFAPLASRRKAPAESERIDLLLTTDILSEGVNLQDASVVLHLDLPWTPARMEQRLGRIARLGSIHRVVHAYAFRPPVTEVDVVGAERILRTKMEEAGMIVAEFPALAGGLFPPPSVTAEPRIVETLRESLQTWVGDGNIASPCPVLSRVRSTERGFVAAFALNGQSVIIGNRQNRTGESPALVLECLRLCDGEDLVLNRDDAERALVRTRAYMAGKQALNNAPALATSLDARRVALRRIARAQREAPPHRRAAFARLASDAREVLSGVMGSAAEHEVLLSMKGMDGDDAWLNHIKAMGSSPHPRRRSSAHREVAADGKAGPDRVIAVLIFSPDDNL